MLHFKFIKHQVGSLQSPLLEINSILKLGSCFEGYLEIKSNIKC